MAGVTPQGFEAKTLAEVISELEARIASNSDLGANINTAPRSALGQLVRIFAGAISEVWDQAAETYAAAFLTAATGSALDDLAQAFLPGGRSPAARTTVEVTLTGTASTAIADGTLVALGDASGTRFTLPAVTLDGAGSATVTATAESAGPIVVAASSTWVIVNPVFGLASLSNAAVGASGRNLETDEELRARILAATAGGQRRVGSLQAALLDTPGVTEAVVVSNRSSVTDSNGRPPKSIEVVVRGGTDAEIAQTILAQSTDGIERVSTVPAASRVSTTALDANANAVAIVFSRPDVVATYAAVRYSPKANFPTDGEAIIQQAVADFDATLTVGQGVVPSDVEQAIYCAFTSPVFASLEVFLGLAPSPAAPATVPADATQLASFANGGVTIVRI
ncbi:MAG: baseplate J/gp47 family protein [Myxococcota bacterium]